MGGESSVVRQARRPGPWFSNRRSIRTSLHQHVHIQRRYAKVAFTESPHGATSRSETARRARGVEDAFGLMQNEFSLRTKVLADILEKVSSVSYILRIIPELDSRYVWRDSAGEVSSHVLKLSRRDFDHTNFGWRVKVHVAGTRRAGSRTFHWRNEC